MSSGAWVACVPLRLATSLEILEEIADARDDRAAVGVAIVDVREPHPEAVRRQQIVHPVGGIFEQHILLERRRVAAMGDELQLFWPANSEVGGGAR